MLHLFLFFLCLIITSCKDSETPNLPKYNDNIEHTVTSADSGDRLNLALLGNPSNLVPFLAGEQNASTIAGHIYQSLLTYDANLNLIPQAAESFKISPNGLIITFILKPNQVFSDGTPLTSKDVSATFYAIINPNTNTPYADDYRRVSHFNTPDSHTIQIIYSEPFAPALASWAGLPIMPAHIIAKTRSFNDTKLKESPLGSGPYQLTYAKRSEGYLLNSNSSSIEYPYIQQLYYRVIPDQSAQWLELKAGQLDILDLQPLAYTRLISSSWFTSQYTTYRSLSNAYTYLGFNLKNPIFADKATRQALSYAIDRKGLIKAVLLGQGEPIASIFKPGTWANDPTLEPYPYNPNKARQLLVHAGWQLGPSGLLERNGKPFKFTLTTNQGNENRLKTAQIIQKFLADIGIDMTIRVQEWSSLLTTVIKPRAFDALLMGWTLPAEPDPFDVWHSSKQNTDEFNIIGFNNKEADAAIIASRQTFNQIERKSYLFKLQKILHDEQPYLWLYAPYSLSAVHRRIQGIIPAPAGLGYNQPAWWIPQIWHLRPSLSP
jgi:peptide/nickel transport system substrate-binding protein